ncbi:23S rRNA pseudouridine(1911/1915/1917) synthase RluD [Azonexus sp.]|uniref:23S rRNA pseudouridine(1911/1915/1917) synthase RluD n=1 Tax=Azonexus sp. TaxID=1872668 RepID=UPI0039E7205E
MNDPYQNAGDYSLSEAFDRVVPLACGGRRLDQVLAELLPQHSRSRLQGWIREGLLRLDGAVIAEVKHKLAGGERLCLALPEGEKNEALAENIPLNIVFEDDALLVINKPPGLVVHPGSGNREGTLLNALLHYLPDSAQIPRAGIVHRLDKDTSGLMVVAKTLEAQTDLVRQLQARTVKRQYLALVAGRIERSGGVDVPIGRHPVQRVKMAVVPESRGGKAALTYYRPLLIFPSCTYLECTLETGRTHQIRVHMAHIAHPLVGDPVYGKRDPRLPVFARQALHATRLALLHPLTQQYMQWEAPPPDDMRQLLAELGYA